MLLGVTLEGTRRVGELLGVAGRLSGPWGSSFLPFLVALGVELGYLFDFFLVS